MFNILQIINKGRKTGKNNDNLKVLFVFYKNLNFNNFMFNYFLKTKNYFN
jgi:hypothetical protein